MSKTKQYYYCNVEGNTDIGCKRQKNEDWLDSFECDNGLVAVVCDGMGGHVGGQIASHTAVEAIRNFLLSHYFDNPKDAIVAACNAANQAILQKTAERPELNGMGSTCVMLIVRSGKVYIGSVGDSRVYLIRSKKIHQLTKDQSYVQMLVDLGQIDKEQAEHHPRKNEITNALGLPSMQPATVLETPIHPEAGDCFLLCSDGLTNMADDEDIREGIRILLESEDYRVAEAGNGRDGLKLLDQDTDLVILDVMLPGKSGLRICEEIRKTSFVPILFLTAKAQESDRLIGLMVGGDDYLSKPFSYAELLGRVKALLRRYRIYHGKEGLERADARKLELAGIQIEEEFHEVIVRGRQVELSEIEYQILLLMMKYPGKIFSAQNLYESVWQEPYFYSCNSTVMVHIRRLRVKIEKDPQNPELIKTVWGKGYRFEGHGK